MAWFKRRAKEFPAPEARSLVLPGGLWAPGSLSPFMGGTAGEPVTTETALRSAAWWACTKVLVGTISKLPVNVQRPDGSAVTPTRMVTKPSSRVSRRGWVAQNVRSMVQAGNIYGRVVDVDTMGRPLQVESIASKCVAWQVVRGEETPFVDGVQQTLWPLGDFWHVPVSALLPDGSRVGMSPVEYASTAIGTSLAAERFGAGYFEQGVHPSAIYYVNHPGLTADQATAIKQTVMMAQQGREPGVLGSDIKRETLMTNPSDTQFIELLRWEVEQACRFTGVPPSMAYAAVSGQAVTYANVTQADLQFLKYSVTDWLVDFEDAWSDLLAIPHSVTFDVDQILRPDAATRADIAQKRLASKTTTVNEIRVKQGEQPFPDPIYDAPGVPGGTQPLGQMVKEITPGVGVLITADEGRAILNEAGAELAIPAPDGLGAPTPAMSGGENG